MRDARMGTYNGELTYCPVNAYGDCPYCGKDGVCHIDNPQEDCDDWGQFWDSWEDWEQVEWISDDTESFADDEIRWAGDVYGYEDTMEDNEE